MGIKFTYIDDDALGLVELLCQKARFSKSGLIGFDLRIFFSIHEVSGKKQPSFYA